MNVAPRVFYRTVDSRPAEKRRVTEPWFPRPEKQGIQLPGLSVLLSRLTIRRWRSYRRRAKRCRKVFSETSVHQLRISLRRLIAVLNLLRALLPATNLKRIRQSLQKQLSRLSRLRDAQIQMQYLDELEPTYPQVRGFRRELARRETRLIHQARKRIKFVKAGKILRSHARRLISRPLELNSASAGSGSAAVLSQALERTFAKVLDRQRQLQADDPATIHRLRVVFKKFRYAVESLESILPAINSQCLVELQEFQALLGQVQDFRVLRAGLKEFSRRGGHSRVKELVPVQHELERRMKSAISKVMQERERIKAFWPL